MQFGKVCIVSGKADLRPNALQPLLKFLLRFLIETCIRLDFSTNVLDAALEFLDLSLNTLSLDLGAET